MTSKSGQGPGSGTSPGSGSRSRSGGFAEAGQPRFLTAANLLSLSRIPMASVFLVVENPWVLAGVVALAAATDLLDGWIARRTDTSSEVGVLLDPFCDKVFVLVGLVSFLAVGRLDWAGFFILILRDLFTAGCYFLGRIVGRRIPFRSRLGGKVVTGLQVFTFFALIFEPRLVPAFVLLVGVASVYAIIDYGFAALRADVEGVSARPST